jgi:hypothetical protein
VIGAVNTLAAGAGSADGFKAGKDTDARLGEAARQFEALLLAQILKSARQSSSGGLAGETDAQWSTRKSKSPRCWPSAGDWASQILLSPVSRRSRPQQIRLRTRLARPC